MSAQRNGSLQALLAEGIAELHSQLVILQRMKSFARIVKKWWWFYFVAKGCAFIMSKVRTKLLLNEIVREVYFCFIEFVDHS